MRNYLLNTTTKIMPLSPQKAIEQQKQLRTQLITTDELPIPIKTIAGADVAYQQEGDLLIAAIVVLDPKSLEIVEKATYTGAATFPYIPGLFSFRELDPLLQALQQLSQPPDLIVCDGQGRAHPRRFGLACHLGVVTGIPTIGCAKTRLVGTYGEVGQARGNYAELVDEEEVIGRVLRTQDGIKPVFVSIGHKISLPTACDWILQLCPKYRLPETTRQADQEVRRHRF